MLYLFFSLFIASLFGIAAFSIYGFQGLIEYTWIEEVFWWVIGTGVVAGFLDAFVRCPLCSFMRRSTRFAPLFCHGNTCH